ncbi:MAG: lysophospholipid acyltransferase family protein [Chloroflexi bacterium]|nr:lysophospholipid acyltransferase family protein [Chloroflexota bacterium]
MISKIILNSRFSTNFALSLGRSLPKGMGYFVADSLSAWFASHSQLAIVKAVQANQWVVHHGRLTADELKRLVHTVFHSTGRCLFDFYHYLDRSEEIRRLVQFSNRLAPVLQRCLRQEGPTVIVTPHISNFDLAGRALALEGLNFQVLSYPQPSMGYRMQNKLRSFMGLEITPMSMSSLQQARQRLQNGGTVITGLDRPMADSRYQVEFFGRKAALPVSYIRLALKVNAPVVVVACHTLPDGTYILDSSDPIPMQPDPDPTVEILQNAQNVLQQAEHFVRLSPEQWSMYYPVWPEALNEVPKNV